METIRVSFPKSIPPIDVQYYIAGSLHKFNGSLCNVEHVGETDDENSYAITADSPESFYLIGMTAAAILRNAENKTSKP